MADEKATSSNHEKPQYTVKITEPPKFDLVSYIANYRGRTVFRRLFLIASCSTVLQEEAARLAVAEAKKGSDIDNYHDAVLLLRSISDRTDGKDILDTNWVAQQEKRNATDTKRLENELKQYKNNLIRESIRMGNEDLGTHYHTIGDLGNALKAFSRMRDFCTSPSHIASTAFRIIAVTIEQRNWLAVQSQVNKIKNLQMKPEEALRSQPKTATALGLQHMSLGEYKEAALAFLSTDPSLGDGYNEVLSSNDVAVYGGLCALASMSRIELQTKVLDNANFRNFLELEPHIRRAITCFCASKYSQCLEILESYRADYQLDIYLQNQVTSIYKLIRTKSIVQYFQPFSRVTLSSMEEMFGPSSALSFQDELVFLIESGMLDARIDLEKSVLIANETDVRAAMQQKALDTVDGFIREARLKLMRLNLINAGLEVKAPPKAKKEMGSGQVMDINSFVDVGGQAGNFQGNGYSLKK